MSKSTSIADTYKKKNEKEHILDNPDTYTGSMDMVETTTFIYDNDVIKQETLNDVIMGLYKLFDEGIVNCRDHHIRLKQAMTDCVANTIPLTTIDISISDDGIITFLNDGNGIDVVKHPEYDIWVPEMIFYHLRTGTNYNKSQEKIVGGKNGFGAKLIFIWSEWGKIETVDHIRQLKYTQECSNNLDIKNEPVIKKYPGKPYTKISFKPDYKRFQLTNLTNGMRKLFKRRVYDIAAVTDKNVKVKYNSQLVPVKSLEQYVDLYIGNKKTALRVHEQYDERWEYVVCLSPSEEFQQVSFVNGIYTGKGGKHIDYILNQIIKKIQQIILKKRKIEVKSTTIKEQLMIFLRCDIVNPSFDSQTKDYMNTSYLKFGSRCEVSDKFCDKVAKLGVIDAACDLTAVKTKKAAIKTDGTKQKSVRGIAKLIDANNAGTSKSCDCTIILCEGDSAKAGIVSGLSKEDRNNIGVYPLKGKLLNVRGEAFNKISENKEIIEIKKILGLETDKEYKTLQDLHTNLRYGKILFMTDQDLDGSHIKGLGINLFHNLWESLMQLNVIGFMNTPILKAKKNKQELVFYNDGEYNQWKQENNNASGWTVKYYKGLGTSTSKEFKEYFQEKKIVTFQNSETTDNIIDLVFNKKRADDRKVWLGHYDRELYLDTNKQQVSFDDFINQEFIHFSKYDCDRSIPNLMDGLKTSQRKILYAAFKKNLTKEIKVAQFSGYVSENAAYHHGEASLNGAIVNMAQDYVGSNNINMFNPNGQFGTRLTGGNDSASERYIYTELNDLTRMLFMKEDDYILDTLYDDGQAVEPIYYAPIIPMILVNGAKGIGTGFSTDIMCYNPLDIVAYLKNKLLHESENVDINVYYEGYKGDIVALSDTKYLIKGVYNKIDQNTIQVTELPIGSWTTNYKEYLESLLDKKKDCILKDYKDMSTDKVVDFTITFKNGIVDDLESQTGDHDCNKLEKVLKLYTTHTNTNMHLFDYDEKLRLYNNVKDIIDVFYNKRLELYDKRKQYIVEQLEKELQFVSNKVRYIKENLDDTIDLRGMKKEDIIVMLKEKNYDVINNDEEYKYLRKMPMDSVSSDEVNKLTTEFNDKTQLLNITKDKTIETMWLENLELFKESYLKYKVKRENSMLSNKKVKVISKASKQKKKQK